MRLIEVSCNDSSGCNYKKSTQVEDNPISTMPFFLPWDGWHVSSIPWERMVLKTQLWVQMTKISNLAIYLRIKAIFKLNPKCYRTDFHTSFFFLPINYYYLELHSFFQQFILFIICLILNICAPIFFFFLSMQTENAKA